MNEEMGLVMRQQEEREALRSLIAQWNANRLDLFELSEPNEELEFHGVMRFYFQDSGQKVATKCIRVASDASAHAVIETLIEKFRPDMRMLSLPEYALYEIHENGEERRLEDEEKPLLVQLNWHNDDREGRFLLRRIDDKTNYSQMPEGTFQNPSFKRKLSKREKKQLKKQEKLNRLRSTNDENDSGVAEKLYTEKPETSFTRSISNPEAVMRRRRQQKLERKLQLFRSKDGGPDTGGTLKIYGEALCKDVPYKTLLLSIGDTAAMVVKEMLAKYGLDKEDPQHYCLAQVNTAVEETKDSGNNNTAREYILDDDECPLAILMNHPMTRGSIMFHVRRRPADYHPRKRKKKPQTGKWQHNDVIDYNTYQDDRLPFLLELNPDGSEIGGGTAKRYRLQPNVTEVGSERSSALSLQLFGPNVQPRHCVLAHTEGLVTVTPCTRDAETYVNNQRIYETTILQNGCTVKFGRLHTFRFLDPCHEERARHRHDSARSPHEYSYDRQSGREDASSLSIHGPGETSTPQHEPTPKQPDNTSMNQGPPNYETTFDVEGNVETRSTSSQGNKEDTRSQRSLSSHHSHRLSSYDTRMVRGTEPILPAVLEIREETEEALLHSIITDLEPSCLGFKLAPAYTLYLAARYRASTHYRPELTPTERAHRLTLVMARVANMIHDVIQERYCEVKWLALWLANASELLHFLKSDRHISAFSLDAQDTLADAVQIAFRHLVACLQGELSAVMPNFLSDRDDLSHDPEDSSTASVLGVLCNGMSLLRMCKVNAALTIQLFSQLFNYVNVWAFNRIVGPNSVYCSRAWGLRLKARLAQIEVWAERQGLELAADCHLAKIMQAAHLLQAPKYTCDDLANLSSTYFKLNSLQLRALLQKYQPTPDEPRIPHEIIDSVVRVAENLADELALADGREVRLEEDPELALPFLLPEDGYSCEVVRGVPPGLVDFVAPLQASGLARLTVQPSSNGLWTVYMGPVSTMMQRSASALSNRSGGFVPSHQEPEVQLIKLHKSNNGMGLSIVAAKGAGQDRLGIYIKSVVKGGAADADGRLQAGDQLLKVDGQSLVGITQEKAAEYLVRTGPVVSLEVAKQGAIYHGLATLLSQPSPLISRGGRRLSERDLPSRVLSDQQSQGGQPLHNRAANHLPPTYPPLHSSKSVPSLNSGSKNEVDRGMLNQTVLGTATIPRQSHEAYNPGYSRTSSTNSISQKGFEQYPNHQIRSRSSQNLTEGRGNVPNTLGRGPNIPQYPVGYPPTPTSTAGYPNNSGYHPSNPGYPPSAGGYPPGAGYPSTGGYQPQGYSPMYHHVHHQPPSQAQQSASPDQERFYQNLSVYRNHDQHNGFVPGRAKLPSPHDDSRNLYQQQQQVNQQQQMQHQQMQQQMQLSQQQQMQLSQQQQQQQQQQMQQRSNTLRGSQSSLQSGSRVSDGAPITTRDRPASAYLPHNNHHLPHQTMPARSQSSRDMMRQEAKLQEMGEEVARREMRVTSPQHTRHPQMGGVSSPVAGSPLKYPNATRDGFPNEYTTRVESPPPPPPTSTHPLYTHQPNATRPPGPGYNASVGEPPKGGFVPTGPPARPPHLYQGSNPWEREQKEREAEMRRNKARQWRDHQITELGSLPQRTPQQEEQLRALSLEKEFEKRAEELDEDEDEDTETNERVQGLLRAAQQNDERRSMRNPTQPPNAQQYSNTSQYVPNTQQYSTGNQQYATSVNQSTTQMNGIIRTPASTYTQVSAEEKARLQRLKDLKMKQAEVEAERMKKKEEDQKRESVGYQAVNKNTGTLGRGSSAAMGTAHLRLDNLVVNTPSNHYHNNNGYPPTQTSPVKIENAPEPPERGSSFTVMSQAMRPPTTPTAVNTTPSKKVSFQEPSTSDPPSPSSSTSSREDPNHFIDEAEIMLSSPTSPDTPYSVNNTPGVIGAQEVYRDPRQKRLAAQEAANKNKVQVPEKMSFKEKMKMFAMETGEDGTPRDKVKISRAQRDIDNIGSPGTPNNNQPAQGNTTNQ